MQMLAVFGRNSQLPFKCENKKIAIEHNFLRVWEGVSSPFPQTFSRVIKFTGNFNGLCQVSVARLDLLGPHVQGHNLQVEFQFK